MRVINMNNQAIQKLENLEDLRDWKDNMKYYKNKIVLTP